MTGFFCFSGNSGMLKEGVKVGAWIGTKEVLGAIHIGGYVAEVA